MSFRNWGRVSGEIVLMSGPGRTRSSRVLAVCNTGPQRFQKMLVYKPVAANSAPAWIIIARTSSPLLSIEMTSFRSTVQCSADGQSRDARQFETSSGIDCLFNRPWRIQVCSRPFSFTVILSIFFSSTDSTDRSLFRYLDPSNAHANKDSGFFSIETGRTYKFLYLMNLP